METTPDHVAVPDTRGMKRVITIVMASAVVVIILALVALGLYFKNEVETGRTERAAIAAQLEDARKVIMAEQERQGARSEQTQAAIDAAVRQLVEAQNKAIAAQFADERRASKAEADRLARKIEAIVRGPQGPPGPPGAPGQPGAKGQCQLVCL